MILLRNRFTINQSWSLYILVDGLHERPEMKKGVGIPQVIEL